ncbi:rhodanese-like domain-containing protein [Phenylobacterium sp.]|uniref:rhodanese-like domain-containing protein n=1 Tax=Phenylobacterium sp. TaxID=1871053 RepID=UPI00286AC277|nr:rhodanese-like domain-containing protein [Phenylobacterium sp.]
MSGARKTQDLTAHELRAGLAASEILLIDVREPDEFALERIPGAVNVPLSTFSSDALPEAGGKRVVFHCAGGKRSASAVDRCGAAEPGPDAQLAGGIAAWKAAGLPTDRGV